MHETALTLTFGEPDFCAEELDLIGSWTDEPDPRQSGAMSLSREDLIFLTRGKDWTRPGAGQDLGFFDVAWTGRLVSGSTQVLAPTLTGLLDVGEVHLTLDSRRQRPQANGTPTRSRRRP